jgi:hypothetical protein
MPDKDWPFTESLEEITNLSTWTETTERFAVPPNVAANMKRLGVTNAPSATALPLTIDALADLATKHWPQPAIENLEKHDDRITFHWLGYYMVVYQNLFVEVFHMTREGQPIEPTATNGLEQKSELFPRTNTATRSFERILQRALEGNPFTLTVLDEETARRMVEQSPDRVFLFWRGTRIGKGMIALCGRHTKEWPGELGELRLAHLSPQLHAHTAFSSAPTIQSVAREIMEHYSGKRAYECRACYYAREYRNLEIFFGVEAIGKDRPGRFFDDGDGPLGRPEYGQALVSFSSDVTAR